MAPLVQVFVSLALLMALEDALVLKVTMAHNVIIFALVIQITLAVAMEIVRVMEHVHAGGTGKEIQAVQPVVLV